MNTDNLNKMADYFTAGPTGRFLMRQYECCALGHSIAQLEHKGRWDFNLVQGASKRLFGFHECSDAGQFLFGSTWVDNPQACAARFRYVALHGDAPDRAQWDRFQFPPQPVEVEEVEETEETEAGELVYA